MKPNRDATLSLAVGLLASSLCACAGVQPPASAATPRPVDPLHAASVDDGVAISRVVAGTTLAFGLTAFDDDAGGHPRQPRGRLGHYSSGDGLVGFVLDRTVSPPRLLMDGKTEPVTLTVRSESERGTDYVGPNKSFFLRASMDGSLAIVFVKDSISMYRDADAASLAGGPPPPSETALEKHWLVPKLRLGHYSAGDGSIGVVLDRTGAKPRVRFDGAAETVVLDPQGGSGGGWVDATGPTPPKGSVSMRFGARGEVYYFKGNRTYSLHRDADADPLP